ncbi:MULTISPECIES: SDR family NAD(P)-dependent oxidoreductase [unclassified Burkholderia]|uniref:SDR family NAD(P)-dependent oxidoreductase n=1 Tax=unclassified Burkholderia TaxID=2613784 RepID=UPI00075DA23C|nr:MULTISPECIES: SDR family oxidoreductase [unclassified Burkholderia]KUY56319.1 oxidoreductase [Burkholderia sp. RF2-non_BP3]KUY70954.1 oxidoreductase [Burkholderia sp. RF4-BP95]KUZ03842.1 oxidoreductase [Burkholderia sp. RF7-non_BP1]KUZ05045.1 oxidoreductase [Burkholderia sp. RF7-non_BP4]
MNDSTRYMLLTGASRGIGHATVKLFQERNWKVFTVSRQPFSEECQWPDARESHIQADLADLDSIEQVAAEVRRRLPDGKLHALVNNAGISPKGENRSRLGVLASDIHTWTTVLNVNLVSNALLARALFPELVSAQGGIVNVTSIAGVKVHPFAGTAYAASKAGLAALTREMAHEFGPHGVRVNAIAPGEIDTSILSPGTEEIVEKTIPLHRLGDPREVAETIYFLSGPASSYINGAEIHINGGQHV